MTRQIFLAAALTAGLALIPVLYVRFAWPAVLAFVPMHYTSAGVPGHFVPRQWLRDISWLPTLVWAILTFLPQVQDGQSLFWSSYRQRRTRLVVVASLALVVTAIAYRGAHHSRPYREQPPTPPAPQSTPGPAR
ncbi:MAG: hypothetical protein ACRYF0_02875 [Janthinobacterium lividum]